MFIHKEGIKYFRDILEKALKEISDSKTIQKLTADHIIKEFDRLISFAKDSKRELERKDNSLKKIASRLNQVDRQASAANGYSNNILVAIDSLERTLDSLESFLYLLLPRLSNYDFVITHISFIKTTMEQVMASLNHFDETSKFCSVEVKKALEKIKPTEDMLHIEDKELEHFEHNLKSWQ